MPVSKVLTLQSRSTHLSDEKTETQEHKAPTTGAASEQAKVPIRVITGKAVENNNSQAGRFSMHQLLESSLELYEARSRNMSIV